MQTTTPNEHQTPLYVACPFFGSLDDRTTRALFPSETSGCFSDLDADSIPVQLEHQAEYCLSLCHTSCPRFLGSTEPNASRSSKSAPLVKVGKRVYLAALLALIALMAFASWRVLDMSAVAAPETNLAVAALHTVPIDGTKSVEDALPVAVDDVSDSAETTQPEAAVAVPDAAPDSAEVVIDPPSAEPAVSDNDTDAEATDNVADTDTFLAAIDPEPTVTADATAIVEDDLTAEVVAESDSVAEIATEKPLILLVREPGANLRTAPGTANEVIGIVPAASEVVALGRTRDFWFFIELADGLQGWVAFSTVEQVNVEAVSALPLLTP
jgi:hypothetical protein